MEYSEALAVLIELMIKNHEVLMRLKDGTSYD